MSQKFIVVAVVALLLVLGGYYLSKQNIRQIPKAPQQSDNITETQTFEGILPCADCSGLQTTLTLNPDNSYSLSEVYQGKNDDVPFVTSGTWQTVTGTPQNPDQEVLVLTSSNGNQTFYAWTNENTITSLDQDKNPIDAPFNLSLTRQ